MSSSTSLPAGFMSSLIVNAYVTREKLCDFKIILANLNHFQKVIDGIGDPKKPEAKALLERLRTNSEDLKKANEILKTLTDSKQYTDETALTETTQLHVHIKNHFSYYQELAEYATFVRRRLQDSDIKQMGSDSKSCRKYITMAHLVHRAFPALVNDGILFHAAISDAEAASMLLHSPLREKLSSQQIRQIQQVSEAPYQVWKPTHDALWDFKGLVNSQYYDSKETPDREKYLRAREILTNLGDIRKTERFDRDIKAIFPNYVELGKETRLAYERLQSIENRRIPLAHAALAQRYYNAAYHVRDTFPQWITKDYLLEAALSSAVVAGKLFMYGLHERLSVKEIIRVYAKHATNSDFQNWVTHFQPKVCLHTITKRESLLDDPALIRIYDKQKHNSTHPSANAPNSPLPSVPSLPSNDITLSSEIAPTPKKATVSVESKKADLEKLASQWKDTRSALHFFKTLADSKYYESRTASDEESKKYLAARDTLRTLTSSEQAATAAAVEETKAANQALTRIFSGYRKVVSDTQNARNILNSMADAKKLADFDNAFRYFTAACHVHQTFPQWIKEDYLFAVAFAHQSIARILFENTMYRLLLPRQVIRLYVKHADNTEFQTSAKGFPTEAHLSKIIERMTGKSLSDGSDAAIAAFSANCQSEILKSLLSKKPVIDLLRSQLFGRDSNSQSRGLYVR